MLKTLDEAARQNLVSKVRNLLFTYGFWYIWIVQDVGDIGMLISQFKHPLTDCMTQRWHADISESSRCDTYKEFKLLLNDGKYLCIDIPFSLRKAFARFRCSSHTFNIELGRHGCTTSRRKTLCRIQQLVCKDSWSTTTVCRMRRLVYSLFYLRYLVEKMLKYNYS